MKKSKIVSLVLTFAMLASMAVPAMAAEVMPISAPATEGHWSDAAMGRWADVGVFNGDQYGDFMPAKEMTRAEFAQVLVNLMGYTEVAENTYADIPADAWYADAMLKLVAAGVMQGTGYNEVGATVSPDAPISREQTAVLLCRALSLKPSANAKIDFPDASSVSDWAKDAVAALTERGMLKGTGDGKVSPALVIDRGSVAQMISNMVSDYVVKDGIEITGEVKGIVIVAAKEVSFVNAKLAETVVVAPKAAKAKVSLANGTVAADVVVSAEGATVTVGKNASAKNVTLAATKSGVVVNGKVGTVTVSEGADNADVTANTGAKIDTVVVAAAGTTVDGAKNTIGTVVVEETATKTTVRASGAKLVNNSKETIGKVAPGATGKAPNSVGGGSSSSGGGSSSVHTGSYQLTKDTNVQNGKLIVKVNGVNATSASEGEEVTVTGQGNYGYVLKSITATYNTDKTYHEDKDTLVFTMPAYDVTITGTFGKADNVYAITKDTQIQNGAVTVVVDGSERDFAVAGDTVTVTAKAAEDYELDKIVVTMAASGKAVEVKNNKTFTMPEGAVKVSATFKKVEHTISSTVRLWDEESKTYEVTSDIQVVCVAGGEDVTTATAGTRVSIKADGLNTEKFTYTFKVTVTAGNKEVQVGESSAAADVIGVFTMPASNVRIELQVGAEEIPASTTPEQ